MILFKNSRTLTWNFTELQGSQLRFELKRDTQKTPKVIHILYMLLQSSFPAIVVILLKHFYWCEFGATDTDMVISHPCLSLPESLSNSVIWHKNGDCFMGGTEF